MKKLLLASNGSFVTSGNYNISNKPLNQLKWVFVTTAQKGTPEYLNKTKMINKNRDYIDRHLTSMKNKGWDFIEINIEGKNENQLYDLLKDKDVVWVAGGNTFYLLKSIRQSGFDKVIKQLIEKGLIYIGASAGSYVACPTIEMSTWKDRDEYDHFGLTDLTAMNLVPFLVRAHYEDSLKPIIQKGISASKYPVRILKDNQSILISGDKYKFIGKGKEVKL